MPPSGALTPCDDVAPLASAEMGALYNAYFINLDKYEQCVLRHGALVRWIKEK